VSGEVLIRGVRGQIANRLRDDILCGRLPQGEHLTEARLAERFGVSRGPIREALLQLTQEGLLVGKPNCGVKVAAPVPDAIRELILPIRRTIETYALRLVFNDLTEADFRAWDAVLDRMKQACREKDAATAVEQDIAFHRLLLERAGQPDLQAIWATIVARIRHHFWQVHLARRNRPIDVFADHLELMNAFRSGNKTAAVKALERHIA
jgi:DNA-binding GntR family transcriptional regulator